MSKDTLKFGPNYSSSDKSGSDILPSSTYNLPFDTTGMKIYTTSSGGGGGGGAQAIYDGAFVDKDKKAGGGGGGSGNVITFTTGKYVPLFHFDNGTMYVVNIDSRIFSLNSATIGAGGPGGDRGYAHAGVWESGGVAHAEAKNGTSATDTKMKLLHDNNNWIEFRTFGGSRGKGAKCHAELKEDYANVGDGGSSSYLAEVYYIVQGINYSTTFRSPASSGQNMIVGIPGYGDISSPWIPPGVNFYIDITTNSIELYGGTDSYLRVEWNPAFTRAGSNGSGSTGGNGGTFSGAGAGGRGGDGVNQDEAGNGRKGESNSYIEWTVYRNSVDLTVISALTPRQDGGVDVTYSKPTRTPEVYYNNGWRDIINAQVWTGSTWERIGGEEYSYNTGAFNDG